jgi:hypothetical protein
MELGICEDEFGECGLPIRIHYYYHITLLLKERKNLNLTYLFPIYKFNKAK